MIVRSYKMRLLGFLMLALGFAGIWFHAMDARKTKGLIMAKNLQQFSVGRSYSSEDVVNAVHGAVDDVGRDSAWYFYCSTAMLAGGVLVSVRRTTGKTSPV
jgi:hypothetical protein